jgi:hypothetical protein
MILFADDTINLFCSHKDFSSLGNIINSEIEKLSEWFKANKLSINIKKSNYMIFKPRQKGLVNDLSITLNGHIIDRVKEVAFLGVILDEHFSWKPHISQVARKISKSIGIIYKASFSLSKSSLFKLYYSLVYPYLQYCLIVWGSTCATNLNALSCFKSALLELVIETFNTRTDPMFAEVKILKFEKIYLYQLGKFMYLY